MKQVDFKHRSAKPITSESLVGAKLFANRHDLVKSLKGIDSFLEVGVAWGDFSQFVVTELNPKKFVGIDIFGWESHDTIWGEKVKNIIGNLSHEEFYKQRMSDISRNTGVSIEVLRGESWQVMQDLQEKFDAIYIDADHSYEAVKKDAQSAISKLKPGGILIFNDYIFRDTFNGALFGIIPVVNDLLASGDWVVHSFAFQENMFCDIALHKKINR